MPSIIFDGSNSHTSTPGGPLGETLSLTIQFPTDGDLWCVTILQDNPGSPVDIQVPSGWTTLQSFDGDHGTVLWFGYRFWHTGDSQTATWYTTEQAVGESMSWTGVDETVLPVVGENPIGPTDNPPQTPEMSSGFIDDNRVAIYIGALGAYGNTRWPYAIEFDNWDVQASPDGGNGVLDGKEVLLGYTTDQPCDGSYGPYAVPSPQTAAVTDTTPVSEVTDTWVALDDTMSCPSPVSNPQLSLSYRRTDAIPPPEFPFIGPPIPSLVDLDAILVTDEVTSGELLTSGESYFETDEPGPGPNDKNGWRLDLFSTAIDRHYLNPSYEGDYALLVESGSVSFPSNAPAITSLIRQIPVVDGRAYRFRMHAKGSPDLPVSTFVLHAEWQTDAPLSGSQAEAFGAVFISTSDVVVPTQATGATSGTRLHRVGGGIQ